MVKIIAFDREKVTGGRARGKKRSEVFENVETSK